MPSLQRVPFFSLHQTDRAALELRQGLDRLVLPLARAAAMFVQRQEWVDFGFVRLDDHAQDRFDRRGRWVRDLAAVGRGVEELPGLADALTGEDGGSPLGVEKARLLTRVATAASLPAWLELARSSTARQLKEAVRQARAAGSACPPAMAGDEARTSSAGPEPGTAGPEPGTAGPGPATAGPGPVTGQGNAGGSEPEVTAGRGNAGGSAAEPAAPALDGDLEPERTRLRLRVPRPVQVAWQETRDLHSALEGRPTSISDFVDSLHAEALAGNAPLEVEEIPVLQREAAREEALALETGNWRSLSARSDGAHSPAANDATPPALSDGSGVPALLAGSAAAPPSPGVSLGTGSSLPASLAELGTDVSWLDAPDAHLVNPDARIRQLQALQDDLERRLARLLAHMGERGAWHRLRFAGAGHYAEERLGMSRSGVTARVFLVRALRRLPVVREAYEAGRIGMSAALELARFLGESAGGGGSAVGMPAWSGMPASSTTPGPLSTPAPVDAALQAEWVARAAQGTLKRLEDETRAIRRKVVLDGETSLRPLSAAAWHRSLRRQVGTSRRRVWRLGMAVVQGAAAGSAGLAARAAREAALHRMRREVSLHLSLPADIAAGFLSAVESARRRLERQAQALAGLPASAQGVQTFSRLEQAGIGLTPLQPSGVQTFSRPEQDAGASLPPSLLAAQVFTRRGQAVPAWAGLLALLEDFVVTWDVTHKVRRAAKEALYNRDGYRCMAPGCTSRRNLEDHHIIYRSRQGDDALSNRVCLCRGHHQHGEHGELLVVRGKAPLELRWVLARRGRGGRYENEMRVDD